METGPPAGAVRSALLLLRPKRVAFLGARSPLRRRAGRVAAVAAAVAGGGGLAYVVSVRMLERLRDFPEVGPILATRLLGLGLLLFLSLLLLSNVIAALSSFFLARDLPTVLAAPVDWLAVYAARLAETLVSSSWMVVLLLAPVLVAYQTVYEAGMEFYLLSVAALIPFLVIPAAAGSAITLLLVRLVPARRTRDLLAVVGLLAVALLVVGLRVLRPERLVDPEGFRNLIDFLAVLETPTVTWLPSEWAAEVLRGGLEGGLDPFWLLLLWTTAAAFVVLGAALHGRLFAAGYTRAQEGTRRRGEKRDRAWSGVGRLLGPLGVRRRELVMKDLRIFFRDPSQWSQLLILGVLLVVYVYNIRVLPIRSSEAIGRFLISVVVLLNLGLSGFVLAAVAARFIFPAFSLEGPALWLLRSSPLPPSSLLWSKFWTGALPLLVLALGLTVLTNGILDVAPGLFALSLVSIAALTLAMVAQALAWGIVFPQFETENAAQIPTSMGGLFFMGGALANLGAVLGLQFLALRGYLASGLPGRTPRPPYGSELGLALLLTVGICAAGAVLPYVVARRRVSRLEA